MTHNNVKLVSTSLPINILLWAIFIFQNYLTTFNCGAAVLARAAAPLR